MVAAARSRMLAIWFAALMLVSIVPAIAPTASAAHETVASSLVHNGVAYVAGTLVKPGDTVSVRYDLSWTNPCTNGGAQPDPDATWAFTSATLDGTIFGATTTTMAPTASLSPTTTSRIFWYNFTPVQTATLNLTHAEGTGKTAALVLTMSCQATTPVVTAARPETSVHLAPPVSVDTLAPTISAITPYFEDATPRPTTADPTIGAINTILRFNLTGTDGSTFKINAGAINGTSGLFHTSAANPQGIAILAGGVANPIGPPGSVYATLNGQSVSVVVEATDDAGNKATVTIPVTIDNVAPHATLLPSFRIANGWLNLGTAEGGRMNLAYTATDGPEDVDAIQVFLNTTRAGATTTRSLFTKTGAIDLGLVDSYTDLVNATIYPVDRAGNQALGATERAALAHSPAFIQGVSLEYGNLGTPIAVTKSGVFNVYANTTDAKAPTPSFASATNPVVFAQLVRNTTTAALRYWENGTQGSNDANHFMPNSVVNTALAPDNDADPSNTAFTPSLAGTTTTSVAGRYVFTNLSDGSGDADRQFLGGGYQLWLNLSTAAGLRTNVTRYFAIDSDPPVGVAFGSGLGQNNNYVRGAGANMTDLHGGDGSPFRVYWAVHDSKVDAASGQITDSKLRNVTFELVDLAATSVVLRTNVSDDPNTPEDERRARVNFDLTAQNANATFPYFYDFRDAAAFPPNVVPPDTCTAPGDHTNACVWFRVRAQNNWSMSWFNETNFSGWLNMTFPDLPAGKYKVRALAYDRANGLVSASFPSGSADADVYKVAPIAKVHVSSESPRVRSDGRLDVIALASSRYAVPPAEVAAQCVGWTGTQSTTGVIKDICPASSVRIYVSNTNGANDAGLLYHERSLADSTVVTETGAKGWPGSYLANPSHANGTLEFAANLTRRYFQYTSNTPPLLPAGINVNTDIFVKVVAVAKDAAGNEIITSTSEWVKATSLTATLVTINQPCAATADLCGTPAGDWPLNVTSLAGHAFPPFNVTFDRRTDSGTPKMRWEILFQGNQSIVSSRTEMTPLNSGTQAPRVVFNWTGRMEYRNGETLINGSSLQPGDYIFKATVYDGDQTLATAWRNFSIMAQKPSVAVAETQDAGGSILPRTDGKWTVGSTFDIRFNVAQGSANLTSPSQIKYRLLRGSPPAGEPATIDNGQFGFSVETLIEAPLEASATTATMIAHVTLPASAANGNTFRLNITAELDRYPFVLGNASGFVDLVLDKAEPVGTLDVASTVASVVATGQSDSAPATNRPHTGATPRAPSFTGFVEDFGSGIKLVEVRLVDLTDNVTLQLDPDGRAIPRAGTEGNFWANDTGVLVGGTTVKLVDVKPVAGQSGRWQWWLNTTGRPGTTSNLYTAASNQGDDSGIIKLDHTYRVDVRFTDNLGLTTATVNRTTVDFDPAPPFLAYKGLLTTNSNQPSGIWTGGGKRTLNWHGEGDSLTVTVNATDNHCLRAVRLVGNSTLHPNSVFKTNMSPTGWTGAAGKVCPNGAPVEWSLNLAGAFDIATGKHFFDDVAEYTLWWEAEDWSGQVAAIPGAGPNYRTLKITVLDNTPASLSAVWFDPPVGQAGGRAIMRAQVHENKGVSHVLVKIGNLSANMTPENVSATGAGVWRLDTTDDLGLALDVGEYTFNVTPYDVNWNRSTSPTCPIICFGLNPLYLVRDDGAPAVLLDTPAAGATLNATPTLKFRALHKSLETTQITVRATTSGNASNLTAVPTSALNFSELKATNGSRQGWVVSYTPGTLADNTTLLVNVTAALASLSDTKQYSFVVDSLAPNVAGNATNTQSIANKTYATRTTRIVLSATDTVSTPSIRYTVNGGPEQTYTTELTPSGADGEWRVEFWATDAAGNLGARQTIALNLDQTGPRITVARHGDEIVLTPVTDGTGVGLNESSVTVHYRYGIATVFTAKKLDKLTANSFGATLPGNASQDGLAYYFTAEDLLGNVGSNFSAAQPYTIRKDNVTPTNLPPTVRITAPNAATPVGGTSVEVRWLAEDPEEAPLSISIALRDPAPGRVLVAAGENSGTYTLNLTGFAAGAYTIVVSANDGEHSASAQVTFNFENAPVVQVRNVPPPSVIPNTQVAVSVALNPAGKTVAQAQYRLLKDGALFTSGLLAPSQGLYGAAFTPSTPGNYSVVVEVVYTDGTTEPAQQVATFRVSGTTPPPGESEARGALPVSLIALVAIAVLTVALAAYGAFGRWKK